MSNIPVEQIPIRSFQSEDEERVRDFFASMGGESRAFFNRGAGNERNALSFFQGKDEHTIRWLALAGNKMVGYCFLWNLDQYVVWLGIAVADEMKGKHLGRRLMRTAETYARSRGYGAIMLTTHVANIRGQALYERCGYKKIGTYLDGEILYMLSFAHSAAACPDSPNA